MTSDRRQRQITLLRAAGNAEAISEPLDLTAPAAALETSIRTIALETELQPGLLLSGLRERQPPVLVPAGRQSSQAHGDVSGEVLHFLPGVIDDVHAREALMCAGVVLADEFRFRLLQGPPDARPARAVRQGSIRARGVQRRAAPAAACGCVPPYPETRGYVARILGLLGGAGGAAAGGGAFTVRLVR